MQRFSTGFERKLLVTTASIKSQNDRVSEKDALGGAAELLPRRRQGLRIIPYRLAYGLVLASA